MKAQSQLDQHRARQERCQRELSQCDSTLQSVEREYQSANSRFSQFLERLRIPVAALHSRIPTFQQTYTSFKDQVVQLHKATGRLDSHAQIHRLSKTFHDSLEHLAHEIIRVSDMMRHSLSTAFGDDDSVLSVSFRVRLILVLSLH